MVGIGGGGLISGIATAVKTLKPDVRIIGVQASGAASIRAALDAGEIVTLPDISTVADGIATTFVFTPPRVHICAIACAIFASFT